MTTSRIYVACLAAYNNGKLHGTWIEAGQPVERIQEAVDRMLEDSPEPNILVRIGVCQSCDTRFRVQVHDPSDEPDLICPECGGENVHRGDLARSAEEWAIHDYEGFGGIDIHEYESFDMVAKLAALLEEHGLAYAAYAENVGLEYANSEDFEEAYAGEWQSEEEFGETLADDLGLVDESSSLSMYIDWAAFAADLFMCDYYSADAPGGVYVFRSL